MAVKQHVPKVGCRGAIWLLTLVLCGGCASWGARRESVEEPWTQPWRTKAENTEHFGVDQQARDIERNLGVY